MDAIEKIIDMIDPERRKQISWFTLAKDDYGLLSDEEITRFKHLFQTKFINSGFTSSDQFY